MVLAVVMAIWALSSRGVKKGSKLFSSENALFWGLAFGFGYAGSIAMITQLTSGNLATTMGFGHLVTAGALVLMHPAVITRHNTMLASTSGEKETDSEQLSEDSETTEPDKDSEETQEEVERAEPEQKSSPVEDDDIEVVDWEPDEDVLDELELLD